MELFFRDDRLRALFKRYAPQIKEEGYKTCEARRDNRVDCKNDSSDASTSSRTAIEGHSIAVVNQSIVASTADYSRNEDTSDEGFPQQFDSDAEIDETDSESSFEEEKVPKKTNKSSKKGSVDIKNMTQR